MTYSYSSAYDRPSWDMSSTPLSQRLQELVQDPAKLAEFLGCTVQAVNQYKQGAAFPKTKNLIKIAEYYHVSLDYLLGFTNIPNRDTSLQAVNQVTGLSEDAIIKLSDLKDSDPSLSGLVSLLLEDSNCLYFLSLIQSLIESNDGMVELNVAGKRMRILDKNLLSAVLQTKLIENIGELAKAYNAK